MRIHGDLHEGVVKGRGEGVACEHGEHGMVDVCGGLEVGEVDGGGGEERDGGEKEGGEDLCGF